MKYTVKCSLVIALICTFLACTVFALPSSVEIYDNHMENANGELSLENAAFVVPEDCVTSEKLVKVFVKLHLLYNGQPMTFDEQSEYDVYLSYCKQNGIIPASDNSFDAAYRPVLRSELAILATNTFPESFFEVKYPDALPTDVLPGDDCYNSVVTLYKSGVANGIERGYYCPNFPLTEAQLTSFVERLVLIDSRLKGDILDLPDMKEAYYLIFDQTMTRTKRSVEHVTSSWNYDNRQNYAIDTQGLTTSNLVDGSTDGYVAINRTVKTQKDGLLTFISNFKADKTSGIRIYFENTDGDNVFEIFTENGVYKVKAEELTATKVKASTAETTVKVEFDLDKAEGTFYVDGKVACYFDLGDFKNISKLFFATSEKDTLAFNPNECYLFKNYPVNEGFFAKEFPDDWETDTAIVAYNNDDGMGDNSLKFDSDGVAVKNFDEISGKVVFETYFYLPTANDVLYVYFGDIKTKVCSGYITNGSFSHDFKRHVWQCLYIEADTVNKTAKIYVNGKLRGQINITDSGFSEVAFEFEKNSADGYVLVDDVEVYNIYDYPDYCPKPIKVESTDYNMIMSVCSLWREGTHSGWDYVSPYDECSPLMGYYDEGIPETADWETKLAVEHGVDAMEYCWYASNGLGTIKAPRLNWALHDGYFHGKYSDMMDFMFMWENQGFSNIRNMSLESFKTYLWDYWVEWYFRDERYFSIDNKAVLHIYIPDNFKNNVGSVENVKAIVDFMREDIKNYGYDGLILLSQNKYTSSEQVTELVNMGYDGNCVYSWDASSYDPAYLKLVNNNLLNVMAESETEFFLVPTVATGRNIMGWENKRTPLADKEQHTEVLQYYKSMLEEQQNDYNLIYFSTWNEYGEGHWLAPSGLNGFDYSEVWRNELCGDGFVHNDVIPTANQRSRICKLYNDTRTPIRSLLHEVPDYSKSAVKSILTLDFEDPATVTDWTFSKNHIAEYDISGGCVNVVPKTRDPMFNYKKNINLDADSVDMIHIRMKCNSASNFTMYFNYEYNDTFADARKLSANYNGTDKEFFDVYILTKEFPEWTDTVRRIRIDPSTNTVPSSIDFIEFLQITKDPNELNVYADGKCIDIPSYYKTVDDGEYYVAGEPGTGFYSANNLYHEWSRFTEKFLLVTANDTRFEFTVGSDTVLVNGKENKLKKPFYLFDGMPVIPLKFVFDNGGIDYEINSGRINTVQRDYDYEEIVGSRIDYQYEFNLFDDAEGWTIGGGYANVLAGNLVLMTTPVSSSSTGYDPSVVRNGILFDAEDYSTITVRMKYEYYENKVTPKKSNSVASLYFTTTTETNLNEAKTVKINFWNYMPDDEGYITLTFDMTSNASWKDMITQIRFDPANFNGKYEIDYIRVT